MSSFFGSTGFTPEGTSQQSQTLNTVMQGNMGTTAPGDSGKYQTLVDMGYSPEQASAAAGGTGATTPTPNPSLQSGFYSPGSSGYDFTGQKNTYSPQTYNPSTVNLTDMAKQYYQPVLANAQGATMQGGQNAANQMMGQLGARGIQGGGVAQMAQGNIGNSMANQMSNNTANIGMQQANALTGLNTQQQLANQGAQNQAGQFNAGAQNTASQQNIQNTLNAMSQQSNADYMSRTQQMQNYNTPIQQMMQLYGINMGAPGNQPNAGTGSQITGGLTNMAGGLLPLL